MWIGWILLSCTILLLLQASASTSPISNDDDSLQHEYDQGYDDEVEDESLLKEILLESQIEENEDVDDKPAEKVAEETTANHGEETPKSNKKSRAPGGRRGNVRSTLKANVKQSHTSSKEKRGPKQPDSGKGGSYYGGDLAKEQKELLKKREAQRKSNEKSKISSMSGDRRRQLESLLSENVLTSAAQAEEEELAKNVETRQRQIRFKISRKYAKPVEDILEMYNAIDVDFYALLGVGRNWDDSRIKKQYRTIALLVHPDKNPHPDAKAAFDALKDAYDTLSSSTKRAEYDRERKKLVNSRKLTMKRLKRRAKDFYQNAVSLIKLSYVQYQRKEPMEVFSNLKEFLNSQRLKIQLTWEHLLLLPTAVDKALFIGEKITKHRKAIATLALLLIIPKLFYPSFNILFALHTPPQQVLAIRW